MGACAKGCAADACNCSAAATWGIIGTFFRMFWSIIMFVIGFIAVSVAIGSVAVAAQNFAKSSQPVTRQPSQHYPTDHLVPQNRRGQRRGESNGRPELSFRLQMGSLL